MGKDISFLFKCKKKIHLTLKDHVNICAAVLLHLTTTRSANNVEGTNSAMWANFLNKLIIWPSTRLSTKREGRNVTRSGERKQQQHKPKTV